MRIGNKDAVETPYTRFIKKKLENRKQKQKKDEFGAPVDIYDKSGNGLPGIIPVDRKGIEK